MSKAIWSKFFWTDWLSDTGVRRCSLAARGLWMDMLCVAAQHVPIGYVAINGEGLSEDELARLVGSDSTSVATLIGELERNGVFSRNREGVIYSRRMIKDSKKAAVVTKNLPNGKQRENGALAPRTLASSSWLIDFEKWWKVYPHKVGKGAAEKAFERALFTFPFPDRAVLQLISGVERYIASKPKDQPWCHPTTWLNQRRWEDQPAGAQEDDSTRFRRMLEHEQKSGEWPFKTPKSDIPAALIAEFESQHPTIS